MTTATRPSPKSPSPHSRRAREAQQRRRRRLIALAGAIAAVVVAVVVIVVVSVTSSSSKSSTNAAPSAPAPAAVLQKLFGVPTETLDVVGTGTVTSLPKVVTGTPLTAGGKPLVLYLGAEYCPYCAAERWPLIQALSRFGTFSNLSTTTSATEDIHPSTPSFTFHGAEYTSKYLTFQGRELYTNERRGGSYVPLDQPTAQDRALLNTYGNAFPLLDMAGRYVVVGSSYDPTVLHGHSWQDIATALSNPNDPVARGIDGAANVMTAALCDITGGQPTTVCSAPGVKAAAGRLHG